jgi:predicted KAP-like P-loop ATPase
MLAAIESRTSVFSSLVYKHKNYNIKTIILLVVLYGCEIWCLILMEEQRLRVFENSVVRRISGQKRDELTGGWRKLRNEELDKSYFHQE